ncbi:lariat debranching enzyme-like [Wolffia australiana]
MVRLTDISNVQALLLSSPMCDQIEERSLGCRAVAQLLNKLNPPYWFSAHLHCKFPARIQHGEDESILDIGSDPGPHELLFDEEWLAITHEFHSVFPLTQKPSPALNGFNASILLKIAPTEDQDLHQRIKDKLKVRESKPFDFVRTPLSSSLQRNPQMEAFLQFLELPYLLDVTREIDASPQGAEDEPPMEDEPENGIVTDDVDEMEELRVAVE